MGKDGGGGNSGSLEETVYIRSSVSYDEMNQNKGVKHDQGKPDLSILSYDALSEIAKAFEFGAKKYGRYNYLSGMKWTRIAGAAGRHLFKWLWKGDKDEESGLSHLSHLGACCVMLLDYEIKGLGEDDRYKVK